MPISNPSLPTVPAGLGGFAAGLRQDRAAVRAAVAEPWSDGPVEGHINPLKLINLIRSGSFL